MGLSNEHLLSQQILMKLEHLVELIITINLANADEKEELLKRCQLAVDELKGLLQQIIGPHEDYLKTAVKELLLQRLPDREMMEAVEEMDLLCGSSDHPEKTDPEQVTWFRSPSGRNLNILEQGLYFLFPRAKVYRNYKYKGFCFDYYLPAVKLALEEGSQKRNVDVLKKFFCKKEGIRLVCLDLRGVTSSREVARLIKKQLPNPKKVKL